MKRDTSLNPHRPPRRAARWLSTAALLLLPLLGAAQQQLGIGTDAPTQTLDVNGTVRVRGLGSADTRLLRGQSDGTLAPGTGLYGSSPTAPALTPLGSVPIAANARCLALLGQRAYVANYSVPSLQVFDLSNPGSPALLHSVPLAFLPTGLAVSGPRACLVGGSSLAVFDVSTALPVALATINTGGQVQAVALSGPTAYVTNITTNELMAYDVALHTPGSQPTLLSTISTGAGLDEVAARDSTVGVICTGNATSYSLQLFGFGRLDRPVRKGVIGAATGASALTLTADRASVVSLGGQLQQFDIADPFRPVAVGAATLGITGLDVAVSNGWAYVVGTNNASNTLLAYDLTGPGNPVLRGSANTGNTFGVAVSGDLLVTISGQINGSGSNVLQTFRPQAPRALSINADGALVSQPAPTLSLSGLQLSLGGGTAVTLPNADNLGNGVATSAVRLPEQDLYLRAGTATDDGLGRYGSGRLWAGQAIDGPVLYGHGGGALGGRAGGAATTALRWAADGNVALGSAAPLVRLDVDGALALRPAGTGAVGLTADDQTVLVDNRTVLRVTSNSTSGFDRTILLGAGALAGQQLVLQNVGTSGTFEIRDGSPSVNLSQHHLLGPADALRLLWNGSTWLEISYSDN
ncbi:hypothetical protein LJ737_21480 [Hymenobacter sp. 15J16-1T3B]|uniref:hypothetical protein n=1 Tax=Hymenobacter sp. 15J16-1T3B TaxID=2886941 RepID=UPI001D129558|nr:hypothetical protein [Hymenobacter sp. 15J16-1T3B]MCC3159828.1 hypothetical protein [Hymenobacter sp. 15J16-1T3B]